MSAGRVQLWNVATQKPLGPPLTANAGPVYSVAFSPDGTVLASGQPGWHGAAVGCRHPRERSACR